MLYMSHLSEQILRRASLAQDDIPFGDVSLSKNLFFDRLAEVEGAIKTSNTPPKCMWILERGVLRSKAKCLAEQGIFMIDMSKSNDYLPIFPMERKPFRHGILFSAFCRLVAFWTL